MTKQLMSGKGKPLTIPWGFFIPQMDESNTTLLVEVEGASAVQELQTRVNRIMNTRLNLDEFMEVMSMIERWLDGDPS